MFLSFYSLFDIFQWLWCCYPQNGYQIALKCIKVPFLRNCCNLMIQTTCVTTKPMTQTKDEMLACCMFTDKGVNNTISVLFCYNSSHCVTDMILLW